MITIRQHDKLINKIKTLSEIELDQLLSDLAEYINKNNLNHLADNAFRFNDQSDEVASLEDEVDRLEDKLQEKSNECISIESRVDDAIDVLEALLNTECSDFGKEEINRALKILK
jgi:predicted nuclease with TOPRIM domain